MVPVVMKKECSCRRSRPRPSNGRAGTPPSLRPSRAGGSSGGVRWDADILEKMAPVEQQLQLGRHRALTTRRSVQLRRETGGGERHEHPDDPVAGTSVKVVDDPSRPGRSLVQPGQRATAKGPGQQGQPFQNLHVDGSDGPRSVLFEGQRLAVGPGDAGDPEEKAFAALVEHIQAAEVAAVDVQRAPIGHQATVHPGRPHHLISRLRMRRPSAPGGRGRRAAAMRPVITGRALKLRKHSRQ